MVLIRPFCSQGWFSEWSIETPPLSKLLQCFEIKSNANPSKVQTASVFSADTLLDELAIVAALLQRNESRAEKRFGVRLLREDCECAGVHVQECVENKIGIRVVDTKHLNLTGTLPQFTKLVTRIVQKTWEGDDRLRVFPPHQILGQLAVFAKFANDAIEPEARQRCQNCLNKSLDCFNDESVGIVQLIGRFDDNQKIIATRTI